MAELQARAAAQAANNSGVKPLWKQVLEVLFVVLGVLGSLRITVTLFASAIMLILIGTLAQTTMDMWEVIDVYFRSWGALVQLGVFAPESFFPDQPKEGWVRSILEIKFPFPGGKIIGSGMFINLFSAYVLMVRRSIRARTQGKGISPRQLSAGLGLLVLGFQITYFVAMNGNNASGVQDEPFLGTDALMTLMKCTFAILAVGLSGYTTWHFANWLQGKCTDDRWVLILEGIGSLLFLGVWGASMGREFEAPSLRILWQLIQATLAGVTLLAGFWCLARRKAGVLLIHFGVALMMFSELMVARYAIEERITLEEGRSTNYAIDMRSFELAIVDRSNSDHDKVVVISGKDLMPKGRLSHELLPFDFEVLNLVANADIVATPDGASNPADTGIGLHYFAESVRESAGADSEGAVDQPAAFVRIYDKETKKPLSTHLLGTLLSFLEHAEQVEIDETTYDLFLRFKRSYKPYRMLLHDAIRENYAGTSMARHFASKVTITTDSEQRDARIWMNNPLRYGGETFYQADHRVGQGGVEISSFQVVRNSGWMIPYVSCMLVFVGMFYHFMQLLVPFLRRKQREPATEQRPTNPFLAEVDKADVAGFKDVEVKPPVTTPALKPPRISANWIFPALAAALALLMLGSGVLRGRYSEPKKGKFDVKAFGQLPVMFEGRVKPLDTLARNTLLVLSERQSVKQGGKVKEYAGPNKEENSKDKESDAKLDWPKKASTVSASQWLLDVIGDDEEAKKYRVFRITSLELIDALGLNRRKGFRYSYGELESRFDRVREPLDAARVKARKDESLLDTFERKLLEFDTKRRTYERLIAAFKTISFFTPPERLVKDRTLIMRMQRELQVASEDTNLLMGTSPPLFCPPLGRDSDDWVLPMQAQTDNQLLGIMALAEEKEADINPFPELLQKMVATYQADEPIKFNRTVRRYMSELDKHEPPAWDDGKVRTEAFVNRSALLSYSGGLYVLAFVMTVISWLCLQRPMGRAALATILLAFTAHTVFLILRIYISGRPPVTNLYSSAVFIGWGGILFGLALESLFRMGIGNAVAAFCGFASAFIANGLESSGTDTMAVLVAVLDTQFWLATHVVLVTLGYTATFVSGFIGTLFILMGLCSRSLNKTGRRNMYRMMYGTTCFAIFFSFIGTVLGGLWADDSWGRFWGWDPKENGALIIVLWNTLVLHARFGGMVKERGFAVLAVMGNVCTAWSWFGVNELGIGLHSYGFTEGALMKLMCYVFVQCVIIGVGVIPLKFWWSYRADST